LGLALYGVLAIAVSLVTLGFSLWIWESRLQVAARELLRGGVFGVAVLALLVVVFVGPLLLALVARLVGLGRTAMRTVAARRRPGSGPSPEATSIAGSPSATRSPGASARRSTSVTRSPAFPSSAGSTRWSSRASRRGCGPSG